MTREEAIKIMSQMIKDEEGFLSDNTVEAHKMAIKALEQEPCEDCVRRSDVFKEILNWIGRGEHKYTQATFYLCKRIKELKSVKPNTDKESKMESEV